MTTTCKVKPGDCQIECYISIRSKGKECVFIDITSTCERVTAFARELFNLEMREIIAPVHKNHIWRTAGLKGCHPSCPVPLAVIKGVEIECEMAIPKTLTIEFERIRQ